MTDFHWIMPGGKIVQSVTSLTLANNTAKTQDLTVGTGKRWLLMSMKWTNPDNVTRAMTLILYKEAAKTNLLRTFWSGNMATVEQRTVPYYHVNDATMGTNPGLSDLRFPTILDAGNTLEFVWAAGGASAGGTDADGIVIEYLEVDA